MSQVTTTAALYQQSSTQSIQTIDENYIPAWSYITIVEKNIETQTMLVTQFPLF